MLLKRLNKTVFVSEGKFTTRNMNFPKEALDLLGKDYIFDIYEDHIEMTPITNMKRLADLENK